MFSREIEKRNETVPYVLMLTPGIESCIRCRSHCRIFYVVVWMDVFIFMFYVRDNGFTVSLDTRGLCSRFCMSVLVNRVTLRSKPVFKLVIFRY